MHSGCRRVMLFGGLALVLAAVLPGGECAVAVESFSIATNRIPTYGNTIDLVCKLVDTGNKWLGFFSKVFPNETEHNIYTFDKSQCLRRAWADRYNCSVNATEGMAYLKMTNIQRSDEGKWICREGLSVKEYVLTVYTVPSSISCANLTDENKKLWIGSVTIVCKTDDCTYKDPLFTWYYQINTSTKEYTDVEDSITSDGNGCEDDKQIYESVLTLPKYTTAPDNRTFAARFQCKLSFMGYDFSKWTDNTPEVLFAVRVTDAIIKEGSRNLTTGEVLNVTQGHPKELTCATGVSRPEAWITWYIGDVRQTQNGSVFLYTPKDDDDNLKIFCTAFNIQLEQEAVMSQKPVLYVRVPVASVTLKQGNLQPGEGENVTVTAGSSVEFTCIPSHSRPLPTITWYIEGIIQQSSGRTFILNATSADHGKEMYCMAHNIDNVTSLKPKLYVRVPAETPTILNGTKTSIVLLEDENYQLHCRSTETRPAANITWKIGLNSLNATTSVEHIGIDGLVRVISKASLHVSRVYHNTTIICQSSIKNQTTPPETDKVIIVFWRPGRPTVREVNSQFPWTEGQKGELECISDDSGNPTSAIRWINKIGTIDDRNHLVMTDLNYIDNGHAVKCRMENNFTLTKNSNIESMEVQLDIQFSPKFYMPNTVFAGRPYDNITIPVPFLVNPNDTTVELLVNNTRVNNSEKYSLVTEEAIININPLIAPVDQKMGYQVNLTIFNLNEGDFTVYVLNISNAINSTRISISVTSESEPLLPTSFRLMELIGSTLVFYWEKGFNGGHVQKFLLQVTEAGIDNWKNSTVVDEFDTRNTLANGSYIANISDLDPGTYSVRLIALNRVGKAQPVLLKSDIEIAPPELQAQSPPVGAAVGGGIGATILIITVIILAVVCKRRLNSKLTDDDSRKTILTSKSLSDAKDSDDKAEINLNPMYESSETVLPATNTDVYAKVNKQSFQPSPGASSDVYSVVNKMKGKNDTKSSKDKKKKEDGIKKKPKPSSQAEGKEKKKKEDGLKKKPKESSQADGMVYENAEITAGKDKGTDNVYENPVCSSSGEKPYRVKNDDGLIYIEVELPQQRDALNKQPVIHGDDRTIYADVAYGQVGEPKPESDEEEK